MWKGIIEKESLKDVSILKTLKIKEISKEHHPKENPPLWHVYKIIISDKNLTKLIKNLAEKYMDNGWFSLFWNKTTVYVIMKEDIIQLKNKDPWDKKEFANLIKRGKYHKIHKKWFENMRNSMNNW